MPLHDDDDDVPFDNDDDCVALDDDDDSSDNEPVQTLHFRFVFFFIFHYVFP